MSLSGRYISCKRAIDRVYQDYNLEVDIEEAIEWTGDVLDFIGCPLMLKNIVTNGVPDEDGIVHSPVPISSYRAPIPLDLHEILGILDYESKQCLYGITDTFYKSYASLDYPNLLEETSYAVNNNYIFTGYESGYLEISYKAFALDAEGYPLVPDDTKITRAITSYIGRNIDRRNWRAGRVSGEVFKESDKEYMWAIASASSKANIPSIAEMESWQRARIQLLPRIKLFQTAFRQPQTTNIQLHVENLQDRVQVVGDAQSVILDLSLYGVTALNSTNLVLNWNLLNTGLGNNTRTINIYKNNTKTAPNLVAHVTGQILNGNMLNLIVVADNSSGITGNVTLNISTLGVVDDTDQGNLIVFVRQPS
jgi:hypothetical protein